MKISVIICSHNPRGDYLRRTLEGLKAQTLAKEQWELLLIDNASKERLSEAWDLSWHPGRRHIREEELGLTAARLRGIREAKGEMMLFVDDDNVLKPDYLAKILEIRSQLPLMEVIGSGSIVGEFETTPEEWMKPHLSMLALRELERDLWSNDPLRLGLYPCGAGMCITRRVAETYREFLMKDPRRKQFDRCGTALVSGGDDDICFTAGSMGVGVGMFKALGLVHLIPAVRLTENYLLRLTEGMHFSGYVLGCLWGKPNLPPVHSMRWRIGYWRMRRRMAPVQRLFADAQVRGEKRAWEVIRSMGIAGAGEATSC